MCGFLPPIDNVSAFQAGSHRYSMCAISLFLFFWTGHKDKAAAEESARRSHTTTLLLTATFKNAKKLFCFVFKRGAAFALLITTACNHARPFYETSPSGRRFASNFLGILATPLISFI